MKGIFIVSSWFRIVGAWPASRLSYVAALSDTKRRNTGREHRHEKAGDIQDIWRVPFLYLRHRVSR
jgi:hypothetical protein